MIVHQQQTQNISPAKDGIMDINNTFKITTINVAGLNTNLKQEQLTNKKLKDLINPEVTYKFIKQYYDTIMELMQKLQIQRKPLLEMNIREFKDLVIDLFKITQIKYVEEDDLYKEEQIKYYIDKRYKELQDNKKHMLDSILNKKRKKITLDKVLIEKDGKKVNNGIIMNDRWQRQYVPKNDIDNEWYNTAVKEITEEEWKDTIQELAKDKVADLSKVSNEELRHLGINIMALTLKLANMCLQIGDILGEWREALLYPIPKTMKWEHILSAVIAEKNILKGGNHAALPGRSTETIYYDPLLTEIDNLRMGYKIEYNWKTNIQASYKKSLSAIISSQTYMDDVTWLIGSKHLLERILFIADEFNKMNNIQTNYEKFAMTMNEELQTKTSLVTTIPNSVIHSSLGYGVKDIGTIQLQRQSEMILTKALTTKWNIKSCNLKVKHNIIAAMLAIIYDYNLTFRRGDRLLNFRDLRTTLGINTKGRKPSWFKVIKQKCLLEKDFSRRLKGEFHMERSCKSIRNDLIIEVKKRNWLAFYHEKNAMAYLGRVIEIGKEGTIVEHWIHDIGVDNISSSVQLPIIKKCTGCDLKKIYTKSKRKGVKRRCLLNINDSVKINVKIDNGIDQIPSNLLTFVHLPRIRNDLLKIKDSLESVKNIEAYTDRSFKKYTLTAVDMGSAFLINSPKRFEFNVNITDNPSAFKAELIAIILVLLVCPKNANITIYVDIQAIINIFNELKKESLQQISKGKRPYNAWWILGFKIIKFFKLSVLLVKVKVHNNSEYNNIERNVCWNYNPIEKDVTIMIKHIRETQQIEEFFNLHRNEYWNNSETLAEIDWSSTFKVLKGNTELTNFSEHELNSFKVKIRTEELPILDNLFKRKPHVYNSKWKCPMYLKDNETYLHLWKCEQLEQINENIIGKLQQYIQDLILVNSQEENINSENILKEILLCRIWNFNKTYNLFMLAKGFVHIDLVNLFKSYKMIDKDRIRLLDGLVNKLIFDFKVLIWEYKNVKLADLEHQRGINAKMKKSANKSKLVINKLDKIVSLRWEL
ncbi:hypothetical protein C1646_768497 [Rhizophagus diaphanus]|nr:hypothetical protein C1646_768497 [Rhizophagus diaphanus] [Rhizophagus sp. MUCL 43196]